jgi:uncharacterized membrane protein YkvA (DUF1232 family)
MIITMKSGWFDSLKTWAKQIKRDSYALYLACRHPDTPWYARVVAGLVVGYAFSPIDLIPDFVPVLGYLDDLVVVPLGIALAIKLIPAPVLADCREQAEAEFAEKKPVNIVAAVIIVAIWIALIAWLGIKIYQMMNGEVIKND